MECLKFSICIPTYNGAPWIRETLHSILSQNYENFEVIISDDASTDNTVDIIKSFNDKRIKIFRNKRNLGYGKNLQVLNRLANGDVLFLMAQDDILLKDALLKTNNAFMLGREIGAVTRPYYWFYNNFRKPVRAVMPYDKEKDAVISIFDGKKAVYKIIESVGQLSGLAFRKEYIDINFHKEVFVSHVYPFLSIAKKYKIVFLKDYTVAVRIPSSQTRHKSQIYDISPTLSWVKMFHRIFREEKYTQIRNIAIESITTHFEGLIQIKNFSNLENLVREVQILISLRPSNLLNLKFYFFSLGTLLTPRKLLIWLVDNYKDKILSKKLGNIVTSFSQ
jgi:glycosyltransferase involved in cell wall biosynthesis